MRLRQLDSLRGLAATCVVFSHLIRTVGSLDHWHHVSAIDDAKWVVLRSMVTIGGASVLIFFVLSGYVLALTFVETDLGHYLPFAIKRVSRVYLPFAAAIALAAGLYEAVRPTVIPGLTQWFNYESWYLPLTPNILTGHLLMTGLPQHMELDHVMWSLIHEIRISLIFPLIVYFVRQSPQTTILISLLLCPIAIITGLHTPAMAGSLLFTVSYVFLFAIGALFYFRQAQLKGWVQWLGRGKISAWLVAFAILLAVPDRGSPALLARGLSCCGLLALCYADETVQPFLHHPIPLWLGRISYSLYLVHLPVILAVVHLTYGLIPTSMMLLLALVLAFGVAELFNRFIERPSMRLGRSLAELPGIRVKPAAAQEP